MKILFLDQSGKPGGAELCLLDIAKSYDDRSLVALFSSGIFKELLEQYQIPVKVLAKQGINVRKDHNAAQGISQLGQLLPILIQVIKLSYQFDVIYANTPKALIIGAIASLVSRRPLVYHLHDIVSAEHFSATNRYLLINLANRCASLVIANSKASQAAFIKAGGRAELTEVVYNGFQPESYQVNDDERSRLRTELGIHDRFVIGHFSRLAPWKGQHVLIEALLHCPEHVSVLLVGDALFGEEAYKVQLWQQIAMLGLKPRVHFLGFRSDIPQLMAACDLVTHTSIAPEPFGRVIVEAMLCGTPVIATADGGAVELIDHAHTGWLCPPNDPQKLAEMILVCCNQPTQTKALANQAQTSASQRFNLSHTNHQIDQLLRQVVV
jgi:glycosyltransferase involved in cell wall biosynthesis